MKYGTYIYGPQKMPPIDFGDSLTSSLALPSEKVSGDSQTFLVAPPAGLIQIFDQTFIVTS